MLCQICKSSSAKLMPRGTVLFSSRAPIGYITIAKNPICTNQGFKSAVPGIAGTALGLLNGGLGNLIGGYNNNCSENMIVNRYELNQESKISLEES